MHRAPCISVCMFPTGWSEDGKVCVVVLADRILLDLPLERLAVLQGDGIGSVSRDFSLQVFHNRLQRDRSGSTSHDYLHLLDRPTWGSYQRPSRCGVDQ